MSVPYLAIHCLNISIRPLQVIVASLKITHGRIEIQNIVEGKDPIPQYLIECP